MVNSSHYTHQKYSQVIEFIISNVDFENLQDNFHNQAAAQRFKEFLPTNLLNVMYCLAIVYWLLSTQVFDIETLVQPRKLSLENCHSSSKRSVNTIIRYQQRPAMELQR